MRPKTLITALLLLFVAVSIAFAVFQEIQATTDGHTSPAMAGSAVQVKSAPLKVVAYYFHGRKRCNTCRTIQALSQEAIETGFPEDLISGNLEFREVNFEEPGNDHFVTDYDITGSSLVLVEFRDGKQTRFKNLEKVWDLVADRQGFRNYVQAEVRSWLEGHID